MVYVVMVNNFLRVRVTSLCQVEGDKELSNWTKVTQMVSGGVGTWIQDIFLHKTSQLTTSAISLS